MTKQRASGGVQDVVDPGRAIGSLLGLAVGDALGTTLEFEARDKEPAVTGLVGGGPFKLKPGEWTDDTSMALCLAESLIEHGGALEPADLMARFTRWYRDGVNSVTGRCFDIGTITRTSLEHFERTGATVADLPPDPGQAGNGTLMRLAPVAIVAGPDANLAAELADAQSRTTHRAELAHDACRLFAVMLVEAMAGGTKEHVLRSRVAEGPLVPVAAGRWRTMSRNQVVSSGYVLATLEASLWCVGTTDSFADAVLLAANLGDDADTVAAVTGQLAGALYGKAAIPGDWLAQLAWREKIEALGAQLWAIGQDHAGQGPRRRTPTDSRDRISWNSGDVLMFDEDGAAMTRRQVLERQLMEARTDDEADEVSPPDRAPTGSPPLRIAEVAVPSGGFIGITFAPGKKQVGAISGRHDRDLAVDLDAVAAWGAAAVVTLVEAAELKALRIERLGDAVRSRGMEWFHLPIPDVTAPDADFDLAWPGHSARLHAVLATGGKVLVHCKGGLGRAGTISARLLVELGSTPTDAIAAVRAVRPGAIETGAQERWVGQGWAAR